MIIGKIEASVFNYPWLNEFRLCYIFIFFPLTVTLSNWH